MLICAFIPGLLRVDLMPRQKDLRIGACKAWNRVKRRRWGLLSRSHDGESVKIVSPDTQDRRNKCKPGKHGSFRPICFPVALG